MSMRSLILLLSLCGILLPLSGLADGIMLPRPLPGEPVPPPLAVTFHHVSTKIENQLATTTIDQAFRNDYHRDIEGTYLFPIPAGASITNFKLYMDGQPVSGEVLGKDEARRIYEEIVRRMRDPALLEYADQGLFQARVYPIPARGERRIVLEYSELLTVDGGLLRYRYPLNTEKFSARPLQEVSLKVEVHSRTPITSVYCPSHELEISRPDAHTAIAGYEERDVKPDRDLVLYIALAEEEVGLSLLTHRAAGEDGTFLLLAAPSWERTGQRMPKDVVYVLDRSGSMREDGKLEQAIRALKHGLQGLRSDDRFGLVAFSTAAERLTEQLTAAREEEVRRALDFLDRQEARGGTNLAEALSAALDLLGAGGDRLKLVVLLTDGLPTVGETNSDRIAALAEEGREKPRIFTFGVGYDVNAPLLDRLAERSRAASAYVEPKEDLEAPVSAFFDKIESPALADLAVRFSGGEIYDVYPTAPPDLFRGSQLALFGRYRTAGSVTATLTGHVGSEAKRFELSATLPEASAEAPFLPRLWAARKIGYLVDQLRQHGESKELLEEVVQLSKRYGILTPYTSYLVLEDERQKYGPQPIPADQDRRLTTNVLGLDRETKKAYEQGVVGGVPGGSAPPPAAEALPKMESRMTDTSGYNAVKGAEELRRLKESDMPESTLAVRAEAYREVEGIPFYLLAGEWTDARYKAGMPVLEIKYGSAAYFQLLQERPSWGRFLALGERVLFVAGDRALRVGPGGLEELVADDVRQLPR